MATEWRQVQSHYWPKWLIGRLIRLKEVAPFGGTVRLKPDGLSRTGNKAATTTNQDKLSGHTLANVR